MENPVAQGLPSVARVRAEWESTVARAEFTASYGGHPSLASSLSEGWYRYGDSNPGPVAENHVS